jgi:hypothetical protein
MVPPSYTYGSQSKRRSFVWFHPATNRAAGGVERRDVSASETLALFGCHNVNATRYLAHFLTVTFGALHLRFFVLSDGFGSLK